MRRVVGERPIMIAAQRNSNPTQHRQLHCAVSGARSPQELSSARPSPRFSAAAIARPPPSSRDPPAHPFCGGGAAWRSHHSYPRSIYTRGRGRGRAASCSAAGRPPTKARQSHCEQRRARARSTPRRTRWLPRSQCAPGPPARTAQEGEGAFRSQSLYHPYRRRDPSRRSSLWQELQAVFGFSGAQSKGSRTMGRPLSPTPASTALLSWRPHTSAWSFFQPL